MPYIPFTEEQKQIANTVDLARFLEMRGEKLERIGREHKLIYYDGSGKHDSITIRGSTWFDHKNQIGGGAIKFMQEFYSLSFQDSVNELLGIHNMARAYIPNIRQERSISKEKKAFQLPEKNKTMHRVYAYLIKQRYISPDIITHFAKAKLLYEDAAHHNAVFVGVDENDVPRQAHKRSTSSFGKTFRITCEGSDTKYSFAHFGESGKLFVFEAAIDMLSYLTLNPQDWQEHSYIAMNGVYENAVLMALKHHSALDEIILCTDNDEGGIDAVDRLTDILHENSYMNVTRLAPEFKDWNEDVKARNRVTALPSEKHRRLETYTAEVLKLRHFLCRPERLTKQIYATYKNGQYEYLAEYALSGSAYFISRNNQKDMFNKLKMKIGTEYKAYKDKGRIQSKRDNLNKAVQTVMRDLKQNSARTSEQIKQTAKALYNLADCAVKCEVEQELSAPQVVQKESQQVEGSDEVLCLDYV